MRRQNKETKGESLKSQYLGRHDKTEEKKSSQKHMEGIIICTTGGG
jgi:hypothetical protein